MDKQTQHDLDDLLDRWEALRGQGDTVPLDELCQHVPHLRAELERRVRALEEMEMLLDPAGATLARADTDSEDEQLPVLPGYEILRRLGKGGMGVVYEARQVQLRRRVAVKLLLGRYLPEDLRRFRREAEAQAQLHHPNVLQIYEVGEHEGTLYFTMELGERGSLAQALRDGPMPPERAAEIVHALALALQHAHEKNIIHRDVKPGNILFTEDGTPKLADFGLAKRLDESDSLTPGTAVFGTPAYMPPEQAGGKSKQVGPAADVYSLGATLYSLLTARPPFAGETKIDVLTKVVTEEPPAPRSVQKSVPRNLEAICLKCMAKSPSQRYPSAKALADDLDRFLRGEPTEAKPLGTAGRAVRWLRRRPWALAATLVALAATAAAAATAYVFDPNRPVREVQATLRSGAAATLIEDQPRPRWHQWLVNEGAFAASPPGDGVTIQSKHLSLLELLPDPQTDRFRLSARVYHRASSRAGSAGLFFGLREEDTTKGPVMVYWRVSFNDCEDQSRDAPPQNPRGNPLGLYLQFRHNGEPVPVAGVTPQGRDLLDKVGGTQFLFPWRGHIALPRWRQLHIEVTPDKVRASLDEQATPLIAVKGFTKRTLAIYKKPLDALGLAPADIRTRGALGLVIDDGAASFKNVVVTPF